jgi:hypothetical protein
MSSAEIVDVPILPDAHPNVKTALTAITTDAETKQAKWLAVLMREPPGSNFATEKFRSFFEGAADNIHGREANLVKY